MSSPVFVFQANDTMQLPFAVLPGIIVFIAGGTAAATTDLLLETSDYILLETGDKLVLES